MAHMTTAAATDQRDPLYRKKHAGVPGNGGQTAEHERTETGKSVLNADLSDLGADEAAKRAFAEAAMNATSPLDLIDRRVEAVQTYIADKYAGDVTSVSFVSDSDRIMVMSASDRAETPVESEILDRIEADLNDVIPTSAMPTFTEGMTLFAGRSDELSSEPLIGEETLAEYTNRTVAKWTEGQLEDNIPEVEAAAREYAYATYNEELNAHALAGGEITAEMLDGLNVPNTRYFEQHYSITRTDIPGLTRPVATFAELDDLPVEDHYDHEKRQASRRWLLHGEGDSRVWAEVSVRHTRSIPGDYSGRKVNALSSTFNVYTEEKRGAFISKTSSPLEDGVRLGFTELSTRWNAKHLNPGLRGAIDTVRDHFDGPQIASIMSRGHEKVEAIALGIEE